MPWQIERDEAFDKALKALSKKYPKAEEDILGEFKSGPPVHTAPLAKFGKKLWKARAPATDLQRGKSGGFRIVYYWDETLPNWCCLGACYFKGDREDLPAQELDRLLVSFKSRLERFMAHVKEAKGENQSPDPDPADGKP